MRNCSACHNPNNPKNRIDFLKAAAAKDIESDRGLWRDVATKLRNRTMPPVETKLTEDDCLRVAQWIDRLRQTACYVGEYAGAVALRRLNRREYHNTIRDLLGVDFNVSEIFPVDGTGGAGFDTNGETLYVPPLMMERYLEAAQQILDAVIVTPDLSKSFTAAQLLPAEAAASASRELTSGKELSAPISIYVDGDYDVRVAVAKTDAIGKLLLKVDGSASVPLAVVPQGRGGGRGAPRVPTFGVRVRIARGLRNLAIVAEEAPVPVVSLSVAQSPFHPHRKSWPALSPPRDGTRHRALQARKAAQQILRSFLTKAYRRPVEPVDVDRLMSLYDRAAERGDPFEERIKLAAKAVLVWPDFLFKIEQRNDKPGIYPVGQYELASRMSYFLWSTMPDDELNTLAAVLVVATLGASRTPGLRPRATSS